MTENVYERIHRLLSWRRIITFNMILFLVLVVPISVRLAQEDTENRSSAAGGNPVPSVMPPVNYPIEPPKIDRVSQFFGKTGDTIIILGKDFGDYPWESKVFVGNVEAPKEAIVGWSNTILEVQIPESARTGKVWVVINGKQAQWEGSLLLTDVARSAQIGLTKISGTSAQVWLSNAQGVVKGTIEIGHVADPLTPTLVMGLITSSSTSVDAMGKKLKVEFDLGIPLTSSMTNIMRLEHAGVGAIEIVRAELYDANGALISVYADPLNVKVN